MTDRAELQKKAREAVYAVYAEDTVDHVIEISISVALEEAARVAERYVIDEKELHPDVPFAQISLSYKTAVHAGAQYIATAIRAMKSTGSNTPS